MLFVILVRLLLKKAPKVISYIAKDGGHYEAGTDFSRYIDSFLENTKNSVHIDDADAVALFQKYGWTLDYQISAMNNKLNNIYALTGFNPVHSSVLDGTELFTLAV